MGEKDGVYVAEVYGDAVVVNVYKYDGNSESSAYWKIPYTRDKKTGAFTFGAGTKVQRMEVYSAVPDSTISITKSLDQSTSPEEFQEISKSMWKPASLFHGIV